MTRPSSMDDSALAEKQLLELEAMLEQRSPRIEHPAPMQRAKSAFAAIWRPAQAIQLRTPPLRSPRAESPPSPTIPQSRTAYLDGLKGFAALLVYSIHHQVWGHVGIGADKILENAFGYDHRYHFACLPGIRIFFSGGHLAVAIFFIISGYVLSNRPLKYIHAQETALLADNLGSALFRRWIRLYLPVLGVTFLWLTSWHIFKIRSSSTLTDLPEKTYLKELWKWYCNFKNFSFAFGSDQPNIYNDHLWSIPLEFKGSIAVYTSLLALARSSTQTRLLCEAGLVWYFLYIVDGWFCALFVMGMLLCDLDLLAEDRRLPSPLRRLQDIPNWFYYVIFAAALYLGGVPSISNDILHLRKSPGWFWLSLLKPQAVFDFRWFYRFWSATLIMISVPRISWLRSFFEASFCQYLGTICFAFYLVHGPVLWSIGDRVYAATGRVQDGQINAVPGWLNLFPFPSWGPLGLELNFLMPQFILLPMTLMLAEAITKLFDEPSMRFSKWLYNKAVEGDRGPPRGLAIERKSLI